MNIKKFCLICGKEIIDRPSHLKNRKTCSRKCIAEYYKIHSLKDNNPNFKNASEKKCHWCGKVYYAYRKTSKYCSHTCSSIANRKDPNITTTPDKNKIKKPKKKYYCFICNKEIKKGLKYCKECFDLKNKNSKIEVICKTCGKTFLCYKKFIKKYCSPKCRKGIYKGKGNPNYRNGSKELKVMIRDCAKNKDLIIKILNRDNYTCQLCGQRGGNLQVDHIKEFKTIFDEFLEKYKIYNPIKDKYILFDLSQKYKPFWDKKNLQVLCKKCNWDKEIKRRKTVRIIKQHDI